MRPTVWIAAAVLVMFAATERPAAAQPPAPGRPSEHLQRPGVPRLGRVTSQLYRGGQPDARGWSELKTLGVDLVVNFRHEPEAIASERTLVEAQGMRYASIPWRGKENPKPQQVQAFLELLRANAGRTVFVHCERGSERTGVMIAAYRIGTERWTPAQALEEMEAFGFRGLRFGHLKRFVRELPALTRPSTGLDVSLTRPETSRAPRQTSARQAPPRASDDSRSGGTHIAHRGSRPPTADPLPPLRRDPDRSG